MLRLLHIEWLKLKNYRTFWILSVLYLVSIFGINYIVYSVQQNIYNQKQAKGMAEAVLGSPPYGYPVVWQMVSYVSSFLLFMPGLLMIIAITNEYSFKTHRQNIIDGLTRQQFISVKMVMAFIAALVSTLMVVVTAIVFGMLQETSFSMERFSNVGYFFLQTASYCMIALLFAVLFKRGGLAIGIYFLYAIVLENLLAKLLNYYANNSGRYLPLESGDNLIQFPVLESVQQQMIAPFNYTALLVAAILYLGIFIYFSLRKFQSDDL